MNYWTKENLISALPNAKFYGFNEDFKPAQGVRVTFLNFDENCIALIRLQGEEKGIPLQYIDKIKDKASAFLTTDAKAVEDYGLPIIEVENVHKAIFVMARYKRARFSGKVVDITGSAGKSTTTKMCYLALEEYGASANLNQANTNFGIAWNSTNYAQTDKYWINETSLGGGISLNSLLTMPNIAVVTNIAPVHLKPTQPLKNVAIEKAKIFDYIKKDGYAILYKEMVYFDYVCEAAKNKNCNIITFGESEDADVRVEAGDLNYISVFGQKYLFSSNPVPTHILLDVAIVSAILHILGLPIEHAYEKLREFKSLPGRGEVLCGNIFSDKYVTVVDESFNANPLSMKFSIQGFNRLYGEKENKILILGDMAEGGPDTVKQHVELAKYIQEVNPSRVLLCGKKKKNLWEVIKSDYKGNYYENSDDLINELSDYIVDNDYILVKASHSVELFKVVTNLKKIMQESNLKQ